MSTLYDTIGVATDATQEEIKVAYKSKCMETHPDKGGNPDDFNNLKKAYDVLKDINKRAYYDKYGDLDPDGNEANATQKLMRALFNPNVEDHFLVPFRNLKEHLGTLTAKRDMMAREISRLKDDLEVLKGKEDIELIYERLSGLLLEREQMFRLVEREKTLCDSILAEFVVIETALARSFILELMQGQRG